jgi:hypothetical protein
MSYGWFLVLVFLCGLAVGYTRIRLQRARDVRATAEMAREVSLSRPVCVCGWRGSYAELNGLWGGHRSDCPEFEEWGEP